MMHEDVVGRYGTWRKRVFASLWLSYVTYYLCRYNLPVVLPAIMGEFSLSKAEAGVIGSVMFVTYGVGQFVNGQLGDKFGARRLVTMGLIVTGVLNLAFGFTHALAMMAVVWGLNGYFQSMGWSPSIKALANWFPVRQRGRISGLFATSCGVGTVTAWVLAALLARSGGWRQVFWFPAFVSLAMAAVLYLLCRNTPEEVGLPGIETYEGLPPDGRDRSGRGDPERHSGFRFTLRQTVGHPKVWCVGLAYLSLSIVGYGFLYWAPTYLFESQQTTVINAVLRLILLPLAGSLGSLAAGWSTDRFLDGRRAPVLLFMAVGAGVLLLFFPRIIAAGYLPSLLALGMVGFLAVGAHTTIVAVLPMDLGGRQAAASVAGFIDCLGYVGAVIATVGTGWIVDRTGWDDAFPFWAAGAFLAAGMLSLLWRYNPHGLNNAGPASTR